MRNNDTIEEYSKQMGFSVCEHVTTILAYWDRDLVCRYANKACADWFGSTSEKMIGKVTLPEMLGPTFEMNLPYIKEALAGKKQEFERELPLRQGGTCQSLVTYFPDISEGIVRGFIVHVADISYVKELEEKLHQSRREMLRNIFETQENERANIVHILRDSVNQALVYCKILLNERIRKGIDVEFNQDLNASVSESIDELNSLCISLIPSSIAHFGFVAGTSDYIENFQVKHPCAIRFECSGDDIETISLNDKLSLFRIIQDYLTITTELPQGRTIDIRLEYKKPNLQISMNIGGISSDWDKSSMDYKDIEERIEYYGGTIELTQTATEHSMKIQLQLSDH